MLAAKSYIAAEKSENTRPVSTISSKRACDGDGHACRTVGMKLTQFVRVTTEMDVGDGVWTSVSIGIGKPLESAVVGAWKLVLLASLPVEGSLVVDPGHAERQACENGTQQAIKKHVWRT